jgi:hypothetical protein
MARREQLNAAAWRVIDDFTGDGVPYVLYLRNFRLHVLHGPDDAHRELLENSLFDQVTKLGANLLSIQEPGGVAASYAEDDIALSRRAPALSLDDDQWAEYARALIADADLIVSECLMVSPGVRSELEFAFHGGTIDRIALVLAPPGSPLDPVDDEPAVQFVPRAVYADELNDTAFLDSFVVGDLAERLRRIAALPVAQRRALARDRDRKLREYPVTWAGVATGYNARAVAQELADMGHRETDESWWLRFWWHFRRVTTLTWQMLHVGLPESEAATGLVDGYLKMGYLQLRSGAREHGQRVIRGDLSFAEQCVQSAATLVRRNGIEEFQPLVTGLREQLDEVQSALAAHPEQIVVRPRTKPILTRPVSEL